MTALYEICGPDRKFVVTQLTFKYHNFYLEIKDANLGITQIQDIVEKSIPEDYSDFGSWRGWSTFGLDKKFKKLIEDKLEELLENQRPNSISVIT